MQGVILGKINEVPDVYYYMVKTTIKATENGPCLVIVDGKTVAALCRCGSSNNKPHCDGSHSKIGFKAKATEIEV